MSGGTMRPRLDRQPAALRLAEWAAVAVFVIAVYEVIVAGGVALWPHADDAWILALWIAAAAISASGMTAVRGAIRTAFVRIRPTAAGPYATLVSFASGAAAAPVEETLPRLAELVARGTGARQAEVWLADRDGGFRRASSWPPASEPATVPGFADLADLPQASQVIPVSDGGELLGAFVVAGFDGGYFTPRDILLASTVANAAGLLLRSGTGALALPWDERFTAANLTVPTFGNHPLRVTVECVGSGAAVRERYVADPRVLEVLAYFDAATAARHVRIPVQAVPALFDPSVPPPGQFAVVNALAGPVSVEVATAGHFMDYPEYEQEMAALGHVMREFFAE